MHGIYRFYQNGELVGEAKNLLTTNGKTAIMKYLAGYSGHFGRSIRLGIGATAAAVGDATMNFETAAIPVYLISPDYVNTALVFKGRMDDASAMVIYEAGLSTAIPDSTAANSSRLLLGFDSNIDVWSAGVWTTTSRFGGDALRLAPATSTTVSANMQDVLMDLSGYSNADEFRLAYNSNNANTASVFVRLFTDASNYFTYTVASPGTGFQIKTFNKSNFVATGTPSWSNITQATVSVTAGAGGSAQVDFEGLRIDDRDTFADSDILVSRAVLGTPITKVPGLPLDIEYTLDLTL